MVKLPFLQKPPLTLAQRQEAAWGWVRRNTVPHAGIRVTHVSNHAYPEVTGYYIPTLLQWGQTDLANQYARWLVSIQNADGSWSDPSGKTPYTFDTGQILKGLVALADKHPEAIRKGCDWMLTQIKDTGQVTTPDTSQWSLPGGRVVPEAIHLYALEPLRAAGEPYRAAVDRALAYYLNDPNLTRFDTLSHFHAYIIEALIDLGQVAGAREAILDIATRQRGDGSVPAYSDANWVCSTGLFQYALIWYKLGERERADRAFDYATRLQNSSGGFYGGYGHGATYFPKKEISWAVKYFFDALWWKNKNQSPC